MIDFFKKLFKAETSGATARDRLRLVLLSDHLALAPDVVESLRLDLLAVISKYVEVDEANMDVTFEQRDSEVAMLANIPIRSMKQRPPSAPITRPEPPAPSPRIDAAPANATVVVEPAAEGTGPKPRRRRRRRPSPNLASTAPAT